MVKPVPFMRRANRLSFILTVLTVLFCIALVTDGLPWLRGDVPWLPGNTAWRWPYALPRWGWVVPCLLGIGLYGLVALYLVEHDQSNGRYPIKLILWAFGAAAVLPLLLMTMEGQPLFLLFTRSVSTLTGGYQYASNLVTDLNYALGHWTDFVRQYHEQMAVGSIATSPPGWIVVYYSATKFFEAIPFLGDTFGSIVRPLECQNLYLMTWSNAQLASAWVMMVMPLITALGVAPLYKLGTAIFNPRVAKWAVIMWPLVPGVAMFSPRFNTFYTLLALVMLVVLWRGLTRRQWGWIAVAGFVTSMAIFFNLSLIPLGLLAGLLIIGHWGMSGVGLPRVRILIRQLLYYGLGTASVWVIYTGLTGITILDISQLALSIHYVLDRPYVPWLFMHPYDMFLFVGLPIAALAVIRIVTGVPHRTGGSVGWFTSRRWTSANVFAVASGLTLVINVLSGTARGETGRLWLFFAPCWLLLAVDLMGKCNPPQRRTIFALEAACLFSMAAVLRVNFTTLTVPATLPVAVRPAAYPVNAQFVQGDDRFTLVGLSIDRFPREVTLYLHWRADTFVSGPYAFSLIRIPPDKSPMENLTWEPLGWKDPSPPSCWSPHAEVVDTVSVPLGAQPQPGAWVLSLSVADVYTHVPMKVITADGQTTEQVGIGPITIPAN